MRVKLKLNIFIAFVLFSFSIGVVLIFFLDSQAVYKRESREFRSTEERKLKQSLQNYLDLVFEVIKTNNANASDPDYLKKKYGGYLKNVVGIARSIIKNKIIRAKRGELSEYNAKTQAINEIRSLRYNNGTGYIWINDTSMPYPRMIMHPTVSSLNGKILNSKKYNVAFGTDKNLFQAFVEETKETGEGFVDYLWPRPVQGGLSEDQPKLSYVTRIPEWNWIIGTGIYVTDAKEDAKRESLETIKSMRYDNGTGYFWINDTGSPYPKMIMHPALPALDGKILNNKKYNVAFGTSENIFKAFVRITGENKSGEGFVDYLWPKPTLNGLTKELPKLSFVRRYREWGWIVGTGFYIDSIDAAVSQKEKTLSEQNFNTFIKIIAFNFILMIILVVLSSIYIEKLINPLKKTTHQLSEMVKGAGDLTIRLKSESSDEFGDISNIFDEFLDKLQSLIIDIKKSSKVVENVHTDLTTNTNNSAKMVKKISNHLGSIRETVDSLNGSVDTTMNCAADIENHSAQLLSKVIDETIAVSESTDAINHMVIAVNNVSDITGKEKDLLSRLVDSANSGKELLSEMTRAVTDIYQRIDGIKDMVELIESISSQTNLLAMNAAIEAAHAGEAGKGFSVVADEIRKLAEDANESSRQIDENLKEMVESIIKATETGESTSKTFEEVVTEVFAVSDHVEMISLSTTELSAGGEEILKAMDVLSESSMDIKGRTILIKDHAKLMQDEMNIANNNSKKAFNAAESIASQFLEISMVMNTVVESMDVLTEKFKTLEDEVGTFKT